MISLIYFISIIYISYTLIQTRKTNGGLLRVISILSLYSLHISWPLECSLMVQSVLSIPHLLVSRLQVSHVVGSLLNSTIFAALLEALGY